MNIRRMVIAYPVTFTIFFTVVSAFLSHCGLSLLVSFVIWEVYFIDVQAISPWLRVVYLVLMVILTTPLTGLLLDEV